MHWPKLPERQIRERVFEALDANLNYRDRKILGIPATYLDQEQFYFDAPFLKDAAFLSVLIHNPNHIGCHTFQQGESYFSGTQKLETDLIRICAEEIFGAADNNYDGYVASGGTEANLEAYWIYRNYFQEKHQAKPHQVGLLFSEDSHYSVYKGCNILGIRPLKVSVNEKRQWDMDHLQQVLNTAREQGICFLIIHLNMGTTLFGSVDEPDPIFALAEQNQFPFFAHVDAAFGGFIYPFTANTDVLSFKNPKISSITADGHKMLQAPYGTGIFICRKGLIQYARTAEASYVQGTDFTLCGSRSGANAVAVWMILMTHGSEGWRYQMQKLIDRTDHICETLDELGISYFRNPAMNIITLKAGQLPDTLIRKYHLVADNFNDPHWWKIVTMMHVEKKIIDEFLTDLRLHYSRTSTQQPLTA